MEVGDAFMDSAGFPALWDAGDEHRAVAGHPQEKLAGKRRRFVTSEYVVDESITLQRMRHSHGAAADFLDTVEHSEALRLEWIGPERFCGLAALFRRHADKGWSFTDCVSLALMRELRIREAFRTDHHFRQAGFLPLLRP